MKLSLIAIFALVAFGGARLPLEHALLLERTKGGLHSAPPLDLSLHEQLGQLGLVAALGGFRSLVADFFFIQAHVAWERTEWSRVLLLLREATTLQPRAILFWDMAAWHMAWNASAAALNDPAQPRSHCGLRHSASISISAGIFSSAASENNPDRPQLYEALARLYRDKYKDHARAAEFFAKAATKPGAPSYAKRFSAYELSFCEGREQEAYEELRRLYFAGENERAPTLISRLKFLEDKLNIPPDQRIPDSAR